MKASDDIEKLDPTDKPMRFTDVVKFRMKYPADYKGKKHFKDNDVVELHKLQAENWAERKLGSIEK